MNAHQRPLRQHREHDQLSNQSSEGDPRTPEQHDRDRVLHTSALRRLAGVTQVINPREGQIFHNRLTHTLKVAQIARRLAEKLDKQAKKDKNNGDARLSDAIAELGGLEPDALEAASLCHDMGHPPFGHIGENELNRLVEQHNLDGFEGNAQSFRIVTKLALRRPSEAGLDLTYGTLRAMQKYPWLRLNNNVAIPSEYEKEHSTEEVLVARKWGAYHNELKQLNLVKGLKNGPENNQMSLEAVIMDLADDIAYATHDIEDFYRAKLIPLQSLWTVPYNIANGSDQESLRSITREAQRFITWVADNKLEKLKRQFGSDNVKDVDLFLSFQKLAQYFYRGVDAPYKAQSKQKATLRLIFDNIIDSYFRFVSIDFNVVNNGGYSSDLIIFTDPEDNGNGKKSVSVMLEIQLFKYLTEYYVHQDININTQQYGERTIIRKLFEVYFEGFMNDRLRILPFTDGEQDPSDLKATMKELEDPEKGHAREILIPKDKKESIGKNVITWELVSKEAAAARLTADFITRMTDEEATRLYHRLTGTDLTALSDYML